MWIVKPLGRGEQLEVELQTLQSVIRSQKELIEQLEQDVNDLQNLSTIHRGEAEVSLVSVKGHALWESISELFMF